MDDLISCESCQATPQVGDGLGWPDDWRSHTEECHARTHHGAGGEYLAKPRCICVGVPWVSADTLDWARKRGVSDAPY